MNDSISYEKIYNFLEKIFEYIRKIDTAYRKSFEKDYNSVLTNDYPFKNFWIDYLKIGRKFFKKSDLFNTKAVLESESHSSNKISEFKIITNELAIILEENNFIENCISLLVNYY